MFTKEEVPVASSMISFIEGATNFDSESIPKFMCLWVAFNNIYTTIGDREGLKPRPKKDKQGNIRVRTYGSVGVPDVEPTRERELLDLSFGKFDNMLKHRLIMHDCTKYFVYRTPRWHNTAIEYDKHGQRVNGVINVGYTTSAKDPVWSPIDESMYESYITDNDNIEHRNELARQILYLIYTIRCNIFHGGKRMDDAYDMEVVKKVIPLLKIIVDYFLPRTV